MLRSLRHEPMAKFLVINTGVMLLLVAAIWGQGWNQDKQRNDDSYQAQLDNHDALVAACQAGKVDRGRRAVAFDAEVQNWKAAIVARVATAEDRTTEPAEAKAARTAADAYRLHNRDIKAARDREAHRADLAKLPERLRRIPNAGTYRCTSAYPVPVKQPGPSLIPFV